MVRNRINQYFSGKVVFTSPVFVGLKVIGISKNSSGATVRSAKYGTENGPNGFSSDTRGFMGLSENSLTVIVYFNVLRDAYTLCFAVLPFSPLSFPLNNFQNRFFVGSNRL